MSRISLRVNGTQQTVDVDPATPLLYVLSDDLRLNGPKFGCGLGQCGCCTVLVKGQAVRSCITPVSTVAGAEVTTLEGLGSVETPHPIQQAFIDRSPKAGEAEIRKALSGVLCRCGANTRMLAAILRYARGNRA